MVKYDCDYVAPPVCTVTPCPSDTLGWGSMFEDVDYPVHFKISGSGSKSLWSVIPTGTTSNNFVNVEDVGVGAVGTLRFTRVTPAAGPLINGEIVYVRLGVQGTAVNKYLFFNVIDASVLGSYILEGADVASTSDTYKFVFSSQIQCDSVLILFTPATINPFPPPPLPASPISTLVQLYTDNKRLPASFTPYDFLGSFLWPVYQSTPTVIKYRVGTATGTWVWSPPIPTVV